jgi:hypothetical protein
MKKAKQEKPKLTPLPCPFCGNPPKVGPKRPDLDGNAWGYVQCTNARCHVNPEVRDGCDVADERGSGAYQDLAIKRWNKRPNPAHKGEVNEKATRFYPD